VLRSVFNGGPGAIEVLARYENNGYSGIPNATKDTAATIGTNWYLDSIIRLQLNLIHWNTNNRTGSFTGKDSGETVSVGFGVTFCQFAPPLRHGFNCVLSAKRPVSSTGNRPFSISNKQLLPKNPSVHVGRLGHPSWQRAGA
jgi:hypothetical protein